MVSMFFRKSLFICSSVNLENHHKPNIFSVMKFANSSEASQMKNIHNRRKNTNISGFRVQTALGENTFVGFDIVLEKYWFLWGQMSPHSNREFRPSKRVLSGANSTSVH